jgi:hypothetical protein
MGDSSPKETKMDDYLILHQHDVKMCNESSVSINMMLTCAMKVLLIYMQKQGSRRDNTAHALQGSHWVFAAAMVAVGLTSACV